ncbi:class I SAM-dependent methyltransferase [Dongia sp.]|uniref:class I SAM-dependent methyltransferase n=1 Tax=Dongia sp. TaxID=1977262 RepID=UPI003752F89F
MSDHYNQPELAALYDDENVWDASSDFYRDLALRSGAKTLLDLGCGTGLLTRGIVEAIDGSGVGIDPATPMLEVARRKTRGERVEWLEGDARSVRLDREFDLIIMTGNAFQAFLTEADQVALFRTAAAHLAPGGRFAFESRNPAKQEWREWVPGPASFRVQETVAYGPVEIWNDARMNADRILDVEEHYRILGSGKSLRSDFRLRFSSPEEIWDAMMPAGLAVEHCYGDYDCQPFTPAAREIVIVARLIA